MPWKFFPPQCCDIRFNHRDCSLFTGRTQRFRTWRNPYSPHEEAEVLGCTSVEKLLAGVYASELLMFENTPFTAFATLLTPETHTSAIKATGNAYYTRS